MKRNISISILWITSPLLFWAQVLLRPGDLSSDIGWEYILHTTEYKITPASKNQSFWDFRDLTILSSNTVQVVDASSSPFSSDYPDATHCHSLGQGGYLYSKRLDDQIELQGGVAGVTKVLSYDHKTALRLPIELGESQTDSFKNELTVQGVDIVREGKITILCVGTGDLMLPYGTVQDAVLLQSIEEYSDSYDILGRPAILETQVVDQMFYHPLIGEALLRFSQKAIDNSAVTRFGTMLDEEALRFIVEFTAPVREIKLESVTDGAKVVSFVSEWSGPARMDLVDSNGKVILNLHTGQVQAGLYSSIVDLDSVESGKYYLRVEMDGRRNYQKVEL